MVPDVHRNQLQRSLIEARLGYIPSGMTTITRWDANYRHFFGFYKSTVNRVAWVE